MLLTKGGGCPKRISKQERPVHLVALDLILSKAMAVTDPIVGWCLGIVFPIAILESCINVLLSLNSEDSRPCVASTLFLSP
jgi:hypothetical protein